MKIGSLNKLSLFVISSFQILDRCTSHLQMYVQLGIDMMVFFFFFPIYFQM